MPTISKGVQVLGAGLLVALAITICALVYVIAY